MKLQKTPRRKEKAPTSEETSWSMCFAQGSEKGLCASLQNSKNSIFLLAAIGESEYYDLPALKRYANTSQARTYLQKKFSEI